MMLKVLESGIVAGIVRRPGVLQLMTMVSWIFFFFWFSDKEGKLHESNLDRGLAHL